MTAAQPWLPPTALFDGALTAAVEIGIETWRARWVASDRRCSVRLESCRAGDILPRHGWRTACGAVRFLADARMKGRIAASVLQSRRAARASTAPDTALLDALCEKICCDLLGQSATLFGASTEYQSLSSEAPVDDPRPLMRFGLTGPGGVFGFLTVSGGAAARARKSLVKPSRSWTPLESRSNVTAAQPVRVGAHIGTGKVALADLASLAIGDVLVLDRRMSDPFDVTFNGQHSATRPVEVRRAGTALFIQATRKQASGIA